MSRRCNMMLWFTQNTGEMRKVKARHVISLLTVSSQVSLSLSEWVFHRVESNDFSLSLSTGTPVEVGISMFLISISTVSEVKMVSRHSAWLLPSSLQDKLISKKNDVTHSSMKGAPGEQDEREGERESTWKQRESSGRSLKQLASSSE